MNASNGQHGTAVNGDHEHRALEPKVFDAEFVTDEPSAPTAARPLAWCRRLWSSPRVARARSVAAYRVRKLPRDFGRLLWFVVRGHGRWISKAWTWTTYGDLRADARAARVAGDAEARRAAQELIRSDAKARWGRLAIVLHRCMVTAAIVAPVALILWCVDSWMAREDMWPWLAEVLALIDTTWEVLKNIASVVLFAGPVGWLVAAAWEGRNKEPGAGWLTRPDRDDADSWVDERMISKALAHLGISPLNAFVKGGGELV